jgi:hypothetical protein
MRIFCLAVIIFASIICFADRAAAAPDLTVTLSQRTITVSGLAPGGSAVFFGIAQVPIPHAFMNRLKRWAVIVDVTGHDGTATLDLKDDVPPKSVWAVVDLQNAHYGIVSGTGVGLREIEIANPLRKGPSSAVDTFSFDHGYLDLLYIHPGVGAWTWSALGGVNTGADQLKGSTLVALADAKPLGSLLSKPAIFAPGGILVAVDFTRLEIAVVRIDSALIGGAR